MLSISTTPSFISSLLIYISLFSAVIEGAELCTIHNITSKTTLFLVPRFCSYSFNLWHPASFYLVLGGCALVRPLSGFGRGFEGGVGGRSGCVFWRSCGMVSTHLQPWLNTIMKYCKQNFLDALRVLGRCRFSSLFVSFVSFMVMIIKFHFSHHGCIGDKRVSIA